MIIIKITRRHSWECISLPSEFLQTPPSRKILRVHVWTILETCTSNMRSIALTVLELLAFNAQKFRGSRDLCHSPLSKNCQRVMSGLSLETCKSKLKSLALTVLQLLIFNTQKFRGSLYPGHAPFRKIFKGSCRYCPWKHAHQIWSP